MLKAPWSLQLEKQKWISFLVGLALYIAHHSLSSPPDLFSLTYHSRHLPSPSAVAVTA
jgi:hypothetical protein